MSVGTGFAPAAVVVPGYTLGPSEFVNNSKLNQGFSPVIAIDDISTPTPVVFSFTGVDLTTTGVSAVSSGYSVPTGKMLICTGGWGVISVLTGFSATGPVNVQLQDSSGNIMALNVSSASDSGLSAVGRIFWIQCYWAATGGSTITSDITNRGVAGALSLNVTHANSSTKMTANIAFTGFLMQAV